MKHKYKIPVKVAELDELLKVNVDEEVWSQNVNPKKAILNLFIQIGIATVSIIYFINVVNILLCLALLIPYFIAFYLSTTMKYTIFPNRIKFEWGYRRRLNATIPFEDITAINLVTYDNSEDSTIFFATKKQYKIKKYNINKAESRPHITFENIKDGKKVYELLQLLWNRNTTDP